MAGIRPDMDLPAFKHIVMRPTPVGNLSFVKASYKSSYGKIESSWKISGGQFVWDITVPVNTTATVHVPSGDPGRVTESAKQANEAHGVKYLGTEAGAAVYEIGSGIYQFKSRMPR